MRLFRSIHVLIYLLISGAIIAQPGNEVLEYKQVSKLSGNTLTVEKSILIQINNKDSDWISDIEIQYNEGEKLQIVEGLIIDKKGTIVRKLKKKEIITKSDISSGTFFEDSFVKTFKLKHGEYPYRIKYTYANTYSDFLFLAHWYPLLYPNVPTRKAQLQVEVPRDYQIDFDHSEQFNYLVETVEETAIYKWEINDVSGIKHELLSSPYQDRIPHVKVVPLFFKYGLSGSHESWRDYGKWQYQTNEGLDDLPPGEKQTVDRLLQGITDQKEIIKTLYYYMQDHTRYINVSIDFGGLKPYPAAYVCDNRYGDCKALTIYMKALLKYAGIPSYYTKIYAGLNPIKFKTDFPSQQFNHVILCIPLQSDTVWLENTSNYLPFNYLGTFTQNRQALLVDNDNSTIVKTPALGYDDVLEEYFYDIQLDTIGGGLIKLTVDLGGATYEDFKFLQNEGTKKEQIERIEKELTLSRIDVTDLEIVSMERDTPRIKLIAMINISNQIRRIGNTLALKPIPVKLFELTEPVKRLSPIRLDYPIKRIDSLVYKLQFMDDYEVKLPDNISFESKFGSYLENYSRQKEVLTITRELILKSHQYDHQEYPDFYQFIEAIRNFGSKSIVVFNPKE